MIESSATQSEELVKSKSSPSSQGKTGNWTQKCTQSESIHSTILDVHVLKAEHLLTVRTPE